jgi:circadian clock protein KaiC
LFAAVPQGQVSPISVEPFNWLKEQGVSAIVTGERGDGQLTRHGLEEYISDCVILLDHRVAGQLSTRRLRS